MKKMAILISLLLLAPAVSYEMSDDSSTERMTEDVPETTHAVSGTPVDDTEYWALLVAVGVYANNPDMDRPSMLVEVDNLYRTLTVSERWDESHMKVITRENATVVNILQGFRWLSKMADENDVCLVYLTTHGFPILWDLPPFDEQDGMDEALACYRGFLPFQSPWSWEPLANPFGILTDDVINYHLNRIECSGLCVIVDSCHSGGFNDNWSYAKEADFARELAVDLQGRNRVVMTSVPEEDTSYGSYFSHFLIEGMQGYGDENGDGICSAEEAFRYAEPLIRENTGMRPQLFDDYPGELPLTEVELPPSIPEVHGEEIGKIDIIHTFQIVSSDPEGDTIQYRIRWGDGTEDYTGFHAAGEKVNVSHIWHDERTYDVSFMAIDTHGASSDWKYVTVTMTGEHEVDQRQVEQHWAWLVNDTRWLAQSFVPSLDTIAKVELGIISWNEGYDIEIAIRSNLTGDDLATAATTIQPTQDWETQWITFPFEEIPVVPGTPYYIICRSTTGGWGVAWATSASDNPYENGMFHHSRDGGETWEEVEEVDGSFITYG